MCSLHCQPSQGTQERMGGKKRGPSTAPKLRPLFFFQYADPVTDLLDRCGVFRARLFRESCVFHQGCYVKDLSRLGRDLRKTLILDNSPASYIFHPENAVSGHTGPTASGWDEGLHQSEAAASRVVLARKGKIRLTSPFPTPGACAVLV